MSEGTPSRPRRTRAAQPKVPATIAVEGPIIVGSKRKVLQSDVDSAAKLEHLLTSSKSKLTSSNISDILNYENFINLSEESQARLCNLLPPVAFSTFKPTIDPTHPSRMGRQISVDGMEVDKAEEPEPSPATLDPTIFTNSFFTSASLTFQDHLYSSWLSLKAKGKVEEFNQRVLDGTLHAEWKDEAWNRENPPPLRNKRPADDNDLAVLAQRSLLRTGDVVVYKRKFALSGLLVEKDLLVQSIHPGSHAVDLILQPGSTRSLPTSQLRMEPPPPEPPTLAMEGMLGTLELEDAVLDVDGRLSRADRHEYEKAELAESGLIGVTPNFTLDTVSTILSSRTAKCFTVWRWSEEVQDDVEMQLLQDRGGRELMGTVFYLRCA